MNSSKTQSKESIDGIITDFKEVNLYSVKFLKDLKDGLKKSSYFKEYANKNYIQ